MLIEEANGNCITQQIDYDWWPEYYQQCMYLGHETMKCPLNRAQSAPHEPIPPAKESVQQTTQAVIVHTPVVHKDKRQKQPSQWQENEISVAGVNNSIVEAPQEHVLPRSVDEGIDRQEAQLNTQIT
ncbi:hypothetical protein RND71_014469 [Anisodus tanguticus]|uniref:Uncharacterized protein n=1 Tax=Anisodus tanguticus TaxID=243964 RepID=A0AAE1SBN0_9SOLA|nr:hypothetical protein RND71_014469 [Anisodus tanguticus]